MKFFILGILFLVSTISFNAKADGIDIALKKCGRAPSYSLVDKCKVAVGGARFIHEDAARKCSKHPNWAGVIECFGVINAEESMDERAIRKCSRHPNWGGVIECFAAIVDREYRDSDISDCNRRPNWGGVISCYELSGKKIESDFNVTRMIRVLKKALVNIDQGQNKKARRKIKRIISKLQNNSFLQ